MADEFVDFYEILELPLEAERAEIRKRISELYVEAQKHLDHRNFETRVRSQQLFEMTLPQARYILLDAGRRDDYDRLVKASRGAVASNSGAATEAPGRRDKGASTVPGASGAGASGAGASGADAGRAPSISINPLPDAALDPAAIERERAELWNKWKSGLQSAMERDSARESRPASAATTPLAQRIEAEQTGAPQPQVAGTSPMDATHTDATPMGAAKSRAERPKVKFDFGGGQQRQAPNAPGEAASVSANFASAASADEEAEAQLMAQEAEARRINHQRAIIKDELENIGLKGALTGAAAVFLPGLVAMVMFMSVHYPARQESDLPIKNSAIAWMLWLVMLGGLSYVSAHYLSKSMRRRRAMSLQLMSYEKLLRHTRKNS